MLKTPLPENEPQRLAALRSLGILDTLPEERFERITQIAQRLFDVPIVSITLLDANRQWSKSCVGLPSLETSRDVAFCAYAILDDETLVIPDARLDPRFVDNPLVTGEPYIRFYAGQPLTESGGYKIGTLCLIDSKPRQFTPADRQALKNLSIWAENELNNVALNHALIQQREVDRMKSEFISLVSHELRTPLTSIKGYVDLLLDGDAGEVTEEQQEYLEIVKNNSDRLVSLINDLLDVSHIESGKLELQRTSINLARLVAGVTASLRPQIETKHQNLSIDIEQTLPAIWGDADRITQILVNLLSNAYKYTLPGGTISLRAFKVEPDRVRVDVQDTGIGLSPDEQAHLFTKFYRAKNPATQEVGGTGLGLTITRSLVELHDGEITVTSKPGVGSTFSFTLPITQEVVAHEEKAIPPPARASGRVLVVDDEPDIANLIRRYLEHADYHVLMAQTATEALALAKSAHPDLITLDIMLPDADGFTVLEWLKSDAETAAIPVLMLSMMDDTQRGKLLGAVGYLRKPVQEQILLERVDSLLIANAAGEEERSVQGKPGAVILVADDEADVRRLIAENLRRAGYQIVEAIDGLEAVELARQRPPDLALIDIKMPRQDGISALRTLREETRTRHLPVIMMTTSPAISEEHILTVAALGGSLLFSKPHTVEELASIIDHYLHKGK